MNKNTMNKEKRMLVSFAEMCQKLESDEWAVASEIDSDRWFCSRIHGGVKVIVCAVNDHDNGKPYVGGVPANNDRRYYEYEGRSDLIVNGFDLVRTMVDSPGSCYENMNNRGEILYFSRGAILQSDNPSLYNYRGYSHAKMTNRRLNAQWRMLRGVVGL